MRFVATTGLWFCFGMLLGSHWCAGQESAPTSFLETPLAKSAPQTFRELIERGRVTMKFVPGNELPAEEWGRCDFELVFRREFQFDVQTQVKGGKRSARVKVTTMKCDIPITHLVRLRDEFRPPRTWNANVTAHEFDHVAIGCDPRPVMMLTYLAEHLPVIERPILRRDEAQLTTLAPQWINEELDRREAAVTELIRQSNRQLDQSSAHGTDVIADRAAFFADLYSKAHLAERKFPFVDELLPLFEQPDYVPVAR